MTKTDEAPGTASDKSPGPRWRRLLPSRWRNPAPVVGVVRLSGVIGAASPLRPGITLATSAASIERAFALRRLKAVALLVNSPGGSPVQSTLIYKRIRALADENEVPVLTFCEDVAASGGYLLALAGDEIFVDPSSIIGSIGVISAGFGFTEAISRLGIERRIHTAGARKMMLDPFEPENAEDVGRLKAIQAEIHETFKALVRARRGSAISGQEDDLFTGEFWTGGRAAELGLVDGIGDVRQVMRERFGDQVKLKLIQPDRGWPWKRVGVAPALWGPALSGGEGASLAEDVISTLEARALWARFGL